MFEEAAGEGNLGFFYRAARLNLVGLSYLLGLWGLEGAAVSTPLSSGWIEGGECDLRSIPPATLGKTGLLRGLMGDGMSVKNTGDFPLTRIWLRRVSCLDSNTIYDGLYDYYIRIGFLSSYPAPRS